MSDIVATLQRYLELTTPPAAFIGPLPRRTVEAAVAELERLRAQLAAVRAELAALAAEEPDRTL